MKSYGIRNGVRPTITTAEEGTIALVAGDKGAIFYNTDTDSLRTWDGSAFQNVGGGVGPDTVGVTELKPELKAVDISMVSTTAPYGDASFTTSGAATWTAPTGVTSVSVVCVGGGGGGGSTNGGGGGGGGGGGLGWSNSISVVPGTSYNVQVGVGGTEDSLIHGGDSYFISTGTVCGFGGNSSNSSLGGAGGTFFPSAQGGNGGSPSNSGTFDSTGGGGAGGYSGDGGGSSTNQNGFAGLGGGGGGGAAGGTSDAGSGGGGVGLLGEGTSGIGGIYTGNDAGAGGTGGSGGGNGATGVSHNGVGGAYGGGGAGSELNGETGNGASGAVRILWGAGRSFPSTDTGTGGSANDTVDIDWSLGIQTDVYTMTTDTGFTFSNLQAGKTITIRITGAFTPTLPSGLNTDWYNGSEINHIQVYCADSSTPTFVKLFPEASPFAVATPSLRGTPSTASGVGASLTLSPPALFPAGDLMIIVARTGYGSATYATTTLAGWTKFVTGGINYAQSVIFYKISDGTETAVTITSTGQSSTTYQHPSGIWASFKDCVGIGASTNYFSDTAAYTTQTIAGVTGSADSLEVCVMAAGINAGSSMTWGISGGSWALESSVVNPPGFYYGGCAIAIVPGGSPATSPSAITIDTSNAMIRQQAMLRLVST